MNEDRLVEEGGAGTGTLGLTAGTNPAARRTGAAPGSARRRIDVDALFEGVRGGDRTAIGRAITLLESRKHEHRELAQSLLQRLLPFAGDALRIGITGVPGVGKSTFIETFGMFLLERGHRVAVLAIDPSSTRSHGSILGDKTRMARLSAEPSAYVRPSPTSGTLGGVAKATRESMVLLEAAGYDVILIETVGVGQSEVTVANMVDCFAFLALARTGDQLQGIKKGVLELADIVVVNKADGPHVRDAQRAARDLAAAMRLVRPFDAVWKTPSLTMSGLEGTGIDEFWDTVLEHREVLTEAGEFEENRRRQQVDWMWSMVHDELLERLSAAPAVREIREQVERHVSEGTITATQGTTRILDAFDGAGS